MKKNRLIIPMAGLSAIFCLGCFRTFILKFPGFTLVKNRNSEFGSRKKTGIMRNFRLPLPAETTVQAGLSHFRLRRSLFGAFAPRTHLIWEITVGLLFILPSFVFADPNPSDSTKTLAPEPLVINMVKVAYQGKSFWLPYDDIEDIIILTKNGFIIKKTTEKVIRPKKDKEFWDMLVKNATHAFVETGVKWAQFKLLDLSFQPQVPLQPN